MSKWSEKTGAVITKTELGILGLDRQEGTLSPEEALLVAVIVRGLIDALQPEKQPPRQQPDGEVDQVEWRARERWREDARLFFQDNTVEPFSFVWMAEMLSNDPQSLVERIRALLAQPDRLTAYLAIFPRQHRRRLYGHSFPVGERG